MKYLLISVLSIVISILVIYYLFGKFNFFKRHNIIHIPSIPILGAMAPIIFRRMSFVDFTRKIYNLNRDAKYIGFYATTKPVLMLRDPEVIKDVVVKNFDTFINNPVFRDVNDYVLSQNLFGLQNTKWRHVKNLLSPFFTSSKMKIMFTFMSKHAADFAELMSTLPADKSDVNMKDVFDRYTNDVIALCIYGMKIDSIRDPTNKFYICGKDITYMSAIRSIKIKDEIAIRDAEHVTHPDMIQLMLNNRDKEDQIQLDVNDIVAQTYTFYFAGFETSSSVMSFITYKIVANPSIQVKLRQEIDELLNESDGNVTYEAVNKLKYLDAVIKEALRLFSPSVMERECGKAYKLPPALPGEKSFTINKGMIIWIPLYAIHHDEKHYYNPEEFRPERFLNNNHDPPFYFPFGLGPRMCIGRRFSLLIIKVVLFHLLARCELKQCAKTSSIKFSEKNLLMMPKDGFWLNIQHRNDKFERLELDSVTDF
ncbi:PREDICTED: cytochrome P450 9e2-like [Trachymyrmex septentrionalis]|uniref:cytochrome P450 9e2-like n=1 Tax=Trachymyrmex septentrionalis TaxID=34720 RepID=UPI00084F747C|nr:PREDICTED: cytochrome P450 9e2-like [Trachymyrmex septentrionalis]